MAKLDEVERSTTHRVLVFGPPKTGKTELVGGLSAKFDLLWFDLENGYATLLKLPVAQQKRIELIRVPDTRSYPIAIETMLKVIKGLPVEICDKHGKVACQLCKKDSSPVTRVCLNELPSTSIVVVDSLTQLVNSAVANITKNQPDEYKLNYDDWANLGKLMDMFLSNIQQAKYNVVCITHETETELEDGKIKIVPTSGTRNASRNTAKYFDEVVYCEVKNKKHMFGSSTTYSNNILTGSRTDTALEKSEHPSLLDIFTRSTNSNVVTQNTGAANSLKSALATLGTTPKS